MDGKLTSEGLYEQLRAATQSKQKLASLAILWSVLLEQRARKAENYTVALISKLTSARGGLKESSIRNKAGEPYRQLIELFAEEALQGAERRRPKASGSWQDELLAGIDNLATRARVGAILSDNRKLKTELDLLKSAIQREYVVPEYKLADISKADPMTPSAEILRENQPEAERVEIIPPPSGLLQQEVRALEQFISPENLNTNGWVIHENGAIKQERSGHTIARPGFVPGLRKALSKPRG